MSKFTLPKAKRPANLWIPLPSAKATVATTTNTTRTSTSPKMNTTTNPTVTSLCRSCKRWGLPCPFCAESTLHPSPQESNWSDKDWDGNRQRLREQKKKVDSLATATNTIITTSHTDFDCLLDTETAPICKLCKTVGDPCPFEIKPAQPPSHLSLKIEQKKKKKKKEKKKKKRRKKKTKENEVPNDYYPTSSVYDPAYKQNLCPTTPQKRNWH